MSELPMGWETTVLEQLACTDYASITDGPFGSALKRIHYTSSGARVIRLANLGDRVFNDTDRAYISCSHYRSLLRHSVVEGDILIAALGDPLGRACLAPRNLGPAIVKADCFRFRPHAAISGAFLVYWLGAPAMRRQINEASHGVGRVRISLADVKDLHLPLPPQAEQERIVTKLDALSARSASARKDLSRIDSLVTRYKQAVLSKAFSGELTKDWRNTKRVGLTEAEIAEIARLVDVAAKSRRGARTGTHQIDLKRLANIPTSWAKGIVGMASEMLVGFAFKSSWYVENGVTLLRGANIAPGQIDWDDLKSLAPDKAVEYSKYELQRDDIVLAMDRPIISTGLKIAQVTKGDEGCLLVQRVARLRPTTHAVHSYVWWFMNSADFIDHSVSRSTGSDLPHISGDDISTCPLPLPPLEEQKEIVRRIESAFQKIDRLAAEAKRALELTDKLDEAILAKAFRGELVPQNPIDEPASVLLKRIKAERAAQPEVKRGRRNAG